MPFRLLPRTSPVSPWDSENSIRDELFSVERLEQHAASLAAAQPVTGRPVRRPSLATRLRENESVLLDAYETIGMAVRAGQAVTPSAEWLLDNYHLVEEQIREVRDDLPDGYYRQLPKLADGPFAGYPRVFGLVWAFVAHTDSRFDPEMLCRFVQAYQRVQPLSIGELWAIAITLRIVLVENLRRVARRVVNSRAARLAADAVADRLLGVKGGTAEPVATVLGDRLTGHLPEVFAVQLVRRLRDHDPKVTPGLVWLEERLTAQGTTVDDLVHDEHQRQGAASVTTRNIITSMRLVSDVDWPDLFERISLVDEALCAAGTFGGIDFPTRNLYRSAVEQLARGAVLSELEIARDALAAAAEQAPAGGAEAARSADPGYHLIGGGRPAFEKRIGFRPPLTSRIGRWVMRAGVGVYVAGVFLVAALLLAIPLLASDDMPGWAWACLALLGAMAALDAAVALVNRLATGRFGAATLPALELRDGIPAALRTLVAVPTLLTTEAAIEEQVQRLEIHHLASPDGEVHFALLSDWTDAATEQAPGDGALVDAAARFIARLNDRYGPAPGGARFLLLHRRRVWNEGQRQWIGWERKRGKLHELNQLLRGATDTTFLAIAGRPPLVPSGVRYVVTLDADTRLPREAVRRLVGKMAHPLNQPRFDAAARRVVEGYAVLQPRVTPSLPIGREGSRFQRTFSSMNGIDPYAGAVSDVYQDLFGEGSYAGKGIYDVDAFEAALDGRVPESTLLSHDLFEGIFARAGLASDIEVVDEFPSRYDVAAARQHRWARGDWQLLPWLLGRADASADARASTCTQGGLTWLGRWKMVDNLRRTLSAPATLLALLVAWTLPQANAALWTAFLLVAIAIPFLLPVLAAIRPRRRARTTMRSHLLALRADLSLAATQVALTATFLADHAWSMVDAVGRTLFRLCFSHRRLLEWVTAAHATLSPRLPLLGFYRAMAGSVTLAGLTALVVAWSGADAWFLAAPFVALWLAAPAIARWISLSPRVAGALPVSPADAQTLRLVARRTWRYFETFVTPADHLLPPDNFQEAPTPVVAHRTSPTNLGLYLLAAVSARDFGWAGTAETVARLEATLATMGRLERFRGHFYNWYDTGDLRPLDPRYVSSVDSGNLAGHLITLANACDEWIGRLLPRPRRLSGIADAWRLAMDAVGALPDDRRTDIVMRKELDAALDLLGRALQAETPAPQADLAQHAATLVDIAQALAGMRDDAAGAEMLFWARATQQAIDSHGRDAREESGADGALGRRLSALARTARTMAHAMEFGFLFDPARKLLSIGYLVPEGRLDASCYDLLASEARLASFIAIAKGDVPPRHWFRLGRAVTPVDGGAALISWSGSMFEYLMPSLVMRAPAGSLLEQTSRLIVRRQIDHAAVLGLPWGISESAYNVRDLELTYQYSNFGVPGLGLKRGLGANAVVAPYATALAAMVDPAGATRNFARLAAIGAAGRYGFYEAVDYTRQRVPEGTGHAIVYAFMAHHQGMSVVAIANTLLDGEMRARFHAEPIVQATELLLQERTPRDVAVARRRVEATPGSVQALELPAVRRLRSAHDATPAAHLLSNGRYSVMVTAAGSGYSRWGDFAITRWRDDSTRDDAGSYLYLRDVAGGGLWSAGYQPSGAEPDGYDVRFSEDKAEFSRRDGTLATSLEIVVSSEDDAEVRRLSITNWGERVREIEVTSYAELALAPPAADAAHPAFSKLFVQTEHESKSGALLATRRRRDPAEAEIWAAHLVVVEGMTVGEPEFETDRARFLGRGHDARTPIAVLDGRPLSNTVGTVLDPVFACRRRVRLQPRETAHLAYWTVAAASRSAVLDLVDKRREGNAFERAATLAWTQAQVQLRHLGITAQEATLFQQLAGHVLYAGAALRPPSDALVRGAGGPAALWAQGISGDLPIVLVRLDDIADIALVGQLLRAHEYWRMKRLAVDLVILNERSASYVQDLQIAIETMVRTSQSRPRVGADEGRGAVFALRTDLLAQETRDRLSAVARVVLAARRGSLADQLERIRRQVTPPVRPAPPRHPAADLEAAPAAAAAPLEFFNGLGGFAADGREYVTTLRAGQSTPAPWINVVANPSFGFQVAAEGSGYTWSVNSRENQLTPWSNDPVSDRPGEVFYLRDEDTGDLWSPTAQPVRGQGGTYTARHGQGYSRFQHSGQGVELDLLQFVPLHDPIKISRLRVRNVSVRPRRLSLTAYVEWVLGQQRHTGAAFIVTAIEPETGALLARNPWNATFAARVAFIDLAGRQTGWTGDRREFLGRNGALDHPAALAASAPELSGATGAGFDPCGVLRAPFEIAVGETVEIVCFLGEAATEADVPGLVQRYRAADLDAVFDEIVRHWDGVLGTVQVKTPDRAMDLMLNRWFLYQTLVCRVWARSAFYQASGAYGFRDQLQDGMALALAQPALTREHLLRAAARQFVEGDVQHWWLPQQGQGVRTRISDDRIWLAHAVAHYVGVTGDRAVLDVPVPFLEGQHLQPGQHDAFFQPSVADRSASLFEHCARGLDGSLAVGRHGLPLIGTGDWNDGMNRVGEHGRGESVWLGWFLHRTLTDFAALATAHGGHDARAHSWLGHAATLAAALEQDGWDGEWYRRGFFDDGTPFGSHRSEECRIDSIAQSWAVLSGAADPDRAAHAMHAVDRQLIRRDSGLALLFTPPFDRTALDPGYVKGYPPGIRENGGQYTHAAAWSVIAFARLGDGDRAGELFALLNPVNHSTTRAGTHRYKVEPYVAAADVYSVAPHAGRGGWTWYTGSAGWLYQAGIEAILGFRRDGGSLRLSPCIPRHWPGFSLVFRHGATRYEITVENPDGVSRGIVHAELDGQVLDTTPLRIALSDDGATHRLRAVLGEATPRRIEDAA